MKHGGLIFAGFVLMLSVMTPLAAQTGAVNFQTYIADNFDSADASEWAWQAVGSKFVAEGFPTVKYFEGMPRVLQAMQDDPDGKYGFLGTRVKFDRKGDNWLDIYPTKDDTPYEIPFKGIVSRVDMWVWGGGYSYTLEMLVRDVHGRVHTLEFGSINFKGWKNMSLSVPSTLAQSSPYIGNKNVLQFVGFRIRTSPWERVDDFYIFFDEFKVLTNIYLDSYDGYELANAEFEDEEKEGAGNEE